MNEFTQSLIASIVLIVLTFGFALIGDCIGFWFLLMTITVPFLTAFNILMGILVFIERH